MDARTTSPRLAPGTCIELVRDSIGVDIVPLANGAQNFLADIECTPLSPHMALLGGCATPHVARRSRALAAHVGTDAVQLMRFTQPFAYTSGSLAQAAFAPGDTLLAPMDAAFECLHPTAGAMQALWVQRAALPALLDGPAQHIAGSVHLDLLFGYAANIQRSASAHTLDATLAAQTSSHLTDLLALALGVRGDAADQARQRGERAARLAALRSQIARNYHDPQLSVAHLAQQHHMSVRQVQRLFEEDGTTFTACLQGQRLAHVRRALANPAQAGMLIVDLAHNAGFSDLAAFNRLFKRRYGVPPGQMRFS